MGTRNNVEINKTYTTDSSNSTAAITTTAKDQKKEKIKNEAEGAGETGVRLADLPL